MGEAGVLSAHMHSVLRDGFGLGVSKPDSLTEIRAAGIPGRRGFRGGWDRRGLSGDCADRAMGRRRRPRISLGSSGHWWLERPRILRFQVVGGGIVAR